MSNWAVPWKAAAKALFREVRESRRNRWPQKLASALNELGNARKALSDRIESLSDENMDSFGWVRADKFFTCEDTHQKEHDKIAYALCIPEDSRSDWFLGLLPETPLDHLLKEYEQAKNVINAIAATPCEKSSHEEQFCRTLRLPPTERCNSCLAFTATRESTRGPGTFTEARKLAPIAKAAQSLIESGYDGPFMGEEIRELVEAVLAWERWLLAWRPAPVKEP